MKKFFVLGTGVIIDQQVDVMRKSFGKCWISAINWKTLSVRVEISDGDFFYEMWWLALFLAWLGSSNHKLCNEQVLCGPSILIWTEPGTSINVMANRNDRYCFPFHIYESISEKLRLGQIKRCLQEVVLHYNRDRRLTSFSSQVLIRLGDWRLKSRPFTIFFYPFLAELLSAINSPLLFFVI